MSLIGKIVGGAIGFAVGGPLGAIAGTALGHAYDVGSEKTVEPRIFLSNSEETQFTFFLAVFSMLAKVAKIDGRVSKAEIAAIEQFMDHDLNLDFNSKRLAINIFNAAIKSDQTFHAFAHQFYNRFQHQPQMLHTMIDILLRVSSADGNISNSEEKLISDAVGIFNFSNFEYRNLRDKYQKTNDKYYVVLGCNRNDSMEQIKKQYRKLVFEYHPDKIASKGLPEEFTKLASDKFREIQEAYELIKKEKKI
ncbi:co-chaperone DjlA [Desulfococcaceae bacterium HSG9]|nr:co-chaperone DjlA [Desulfococcaceae bacterium HSG9]